MIAGYHTASSPSQVHRVTISRQTCFRLQAAAPTSAREASVVGSMGDRIVVLGATGATGRRVVHLAAAAGLWPVAVARRRDALDAVVASAPGEVEARTSSLDPDALDGALADAGVVVCGVGPSTVFGAAIVEAAIRAGAHYVDFSGEPRWAADVATRLAPLARDRGCVLVPAAGLGAVGELAAARAVEGLERVDELTIAYRIRGMRASVATLRSSCEILVGGRPLAEAGDVGFTRAGGVSGPLPGGRGVGFPTPDAVVLARRWPRAAIRTWMQVPAAAFAGPLLTAAASGLAHPWVLERARSALTRWADRPNTDEHAGGGRATATAAARGDSGGWVSARSHVDDVYEATARSGLAAACGLLAAPPAPGIATWGSASGDGALAARRLDARVEDANAVGRRAGGPAAGSWSPRAGPADRIANLRDVGGLATDSGQRTRPGVLLRAATPLDGDRDPATPTWPPATVVDLRGPDELGGRPHPLAVHGATVHALPLLRRSVRAEASAGGTDWSRIPDLGTAYLEFLEEGATTLAALAHLAAQAPAPVLVHCAAGKDRTGVAVAVLLRAAGVTREAVLADYRNTEAAIPRILARLPELGASLDPTHEQRLMGVPAEAIDAVIDRVDAAPGGAAGWLRGHGVPEAVVRAWRRRLLGGP